MEVSCIFNWCVFGCSDLGCSGYGVFCVGIRRDDVLDIGVDCVNECGCCIGSCDDVRYYFGCGKEMVIVCEILFNFLFGVIFFCIFFNCVVICWNCGVWFSDVECSFIVDWFFVCGDFFCCCFL